MAREKWTAQDSLSLPSTQPPPGSSDTLPPPVDEANAIREDVLANAQTYGFFYAVGMMERLEPNAVRVGGNGPYSGELIRFRHDPSFGFKSGDISKVEWIAKHQELEDALEQKEHRFEVTTAFMGLVGTMTPMPMYLAEEIVQAQDSQKVRGDFLDIFHHRLISFVYRIGVKYDLAREYSKNQQDAWSRRILALAGFDTWAGRELRHIPMWKVLRLAPLLANTVRSCRTVELALYDICGEALDGATVTIEQFAGGWSPLDPDQRCSLGRVNHVLGRDSVLGQECFDKASKAIIRLGPLGPNFRRFLADGDQFPVIVELLSTLSEEPIAYQLKLEVSDQARPPFLLGKADGGRMGVDSWLSSEGGTSAKVTKILVDLPSELPEDSSDFNLGWQSRPQRQ